PERIPPFKRNQYGATVSGPVALPKLYNGRDRLFFLFNWEGLRERKALTGTPSLPLTAWRGRAGQNGGCTYLISFQTIVFIRLSFLQIEGRVHPCVKQGY